MNRVENLANLPQVLVICSQHPNSEHEPSCIWTACRTDEDMMAIMGENTRNQNRTSVLEFPFRWCDMWPQLYQLIAKVRRRGGGKCQTSSGSFHGRPDDENHGDDKRVSEEDTTAEWRDDDGDDDDAPPDKKRTSTEPNTP